MKPEAPFIHVDPSADASESRDAALGQGSYSPGHEQLDPSSSPTTSRPTRRAGRGGRPVRTDRRDAAAGEVRRLRSWSGRSPSTSTRPPIAWTRGCCGLAGLEQLCRMRASTSPGEQGDGEGPGDDGGTGATSARTRWVEDLRPSASVLHPASCPTTSPAALRRATRARARLGQRRLHPRAVDCRTRAARLLLRSGYLANASSANPDTLAVNLSSDRVRLALATLEGMRNGQSIGALLGYRFERGLHDRLRAGRGGPVHLRPAQAFPLVADSLPATQTPPGVRIEAIEASNVLDGLALVAPDRPVAGSASYPFGLADLPCRRRRRVRSDRRTEVQRSSSQRRSSRTSRWPKGCTRPCWAIPTGRRRPWTRTPGPRSRPTPRSSQRRHPGSALTHRVGACSLSAGAVADRLGAGLRATPGSPRTRRRRDGSAVVLPAPATVA